MRAREWMNVPTRRRAAGSWRCRATAFAGVAALLVSASRGAIASAEMTTERTAKWQAALQQYVQDPASHRHDVLRLGKQDADELPPMYRLALADAHMRSGHLRTAARMFGDIAAEEPGEPWQGFAAAGGGWASLMRGDRERARSFFEDASAAAGATGVLGDFMVGMLDARSGDTSSALDRFAKITDDPDASGDMRAAAAMGQGYASLWAGDDPGAEEAFARAATDDPSDRLGDDARYGDAFARWHHGDRDGAASALREILAIESPRPVEHDRGTLVDLSPQKLTRASARRYRRLPLRAPAEQVLNLLDPTRGRGACRAPPDRRRRAGAADRHRGCGRRRAVGDGRARCGSVWPTRVRRPRHAAVCIDRTRCTRRRGTVSLARRSPPPRPAVARRARRRPPAERSALVTAASMRRARELRLAVATGAVGGILLGCRKAS